MTIELEVRDVRVSYGPVEVLHGVSLDVPTGAVTALLGPNGAGKTTLLSAIAGLLRLRSGSITWRGRSLGRLSPHRRARDGMLLIPEQRGVFPQLSVGDNLEVFARSKTGWAPALEAFPNLAERIGQPAGLLSGGEQQMLAMSRALLAKPSLLLLDEISFGLAPRVTRQLFDAVANLATEGTTVVLVEQHLSDALRLSDVVYLMRRGDISFAGEPAELADLAAPTGT